MPNPPATRKTSDPLANVPSIDSALYANLGKYSGALVLSAFEQMGGLNRFVEWAEENPTDFYTKLFGKTISAPKQVEVSGTVDFRKALEAIDLKEGSGYTVVEDIEED